MRYEKEIMDLVKKELDYAKAKHGNATHNSHHEKYAVILEEWEEVQEEIKDFSREMEYYWKSIKQDNIGNMGAFLGDMKEYAKQAIEELIQVVAMIDKGVKE